MKRSGGGVGGRDVDLWRTVVVCVCVSDEGGRKIRRRLRRFLDIRNRFGGVR